MSDHDYIPAELRAPHYEQYLGPWAMKEDMFRAAFDRIARMDLRVHVESQRTKADGARAEGEGEPMAPRPTNYPVTESGVAVLTLSGVLMKHVGSMEEGTSTVLFRRQLRAATNNPAVAGIMILIDSPGGAVAGTFELAQDIAAAAAKKPTHVYIQDLGASAAYWAASQASVISTNVMGIVGSIGTYMPVYDLSGWAEQQGIRVEIIKEGEFKGSGTPGTKITPEQIAEWQRTVAALNAQFVAGVAKGRAISDEQAKALNDGRVHVGAAAKSMKLVDYVETFEQAMKRLESQAKAGRGAKAEDGVPAPVATENTPGGDDQSTKPNPATDAAADVGAAGSEAASTEESDMSQKQDGATGAAAAPAPAEPKAATMAELKASCTGAPGDFLVEQAEKGATVAQAKDAFLGWQAAQIRSRDEDIKKLQSAKAPDGQEQDGAAAPATKKAPGVPVLETKAPKVGATSDGGDFKAQVEAMVKGGMSRDAAVSKAAREDPDAHQAYVDAANKRK